MRVVRTLLIASRGTQRNLMLILYSDVVDCAWSPADRYLASVGLDSKVFIWCGYTLGKYMNLNLAFGS
jgi:WD40 repeat protein